MIRLLPESFRGKGALLRAAFLVLTVAGAYWLSSAPLHGQVAPRVKIQHVAPDQTIQPGLPPQVLLGEDFTFLIEVSPHASTAGYGPFVEIYFPYQGADCTTPASSPERCDGLSFVSAKVVFAVTQLPLTPCPSGSFPFVFGTSCAATPLQCLGTTMTTPTGCFFGLAPSTTCALTSPAGFQKIVLELPAASFVPNQAPFLIEVTARVDSYADLGFPLTVRARGGFRFGTSAQGGLPTVDASCPLQNSSTLPTLAIVRKSYQGPEDETATGPNFVQSYTIEVDIADGQTLAPLKVIDCLPDNMEIGTVPALPPGCIGVSASSSECTGSGLSFEIDCPSVTGTAAPVDLAAGFSFYIPELDLANDEPVLGPSCEAQSINDVKLVADWDPLDPRDNPTTLVIDVKPDDHILTDRCVALQKESGLILDLGAPGPTPGDIVRYTIRFQISDFKTVLALRITDYLSDGQSYIPGSALLASLKDKFGQVSGSFTANDFSQTVAASHTCPDGSVLINPRELLFLVSTRLATLDPGHPRHAQGILTGGLAGTPAGGSAEGVITFDARIADAFRRQAPSLERFVDKDDVLFNCVKIEAGTLDNTNAPTLPNVSSGAAFDSSQQKVTIVHGLLKKTVHAVNGNTNLPSQVHVNPGDDVTFRIQYTLPSGDAEDFFYEDYLPLPIFTASTLSYQGCGPPLPTPQGVRVDGPLCNSVTFSKPAVPANSFRLDFGDLNDPANAPVNADVYVNARVGTQPFADGLTISNLVLQSEKNTLGLVITETEIAPVVLGEPKLRIRKGVVATSKPSAIFTPTLPVPVGIDFAPVTAAGFSGVLNSDNAGVALNSDVFQVDACDLVKFAIVVENLGSSVKGAFDVHISDELPPCLKDPTNLRVVNGLGQPFSCNGGLPCSSLASAFFGQGIVLDDLSGQGSLAPYSPKGGTNLAVITFTARVPCKARATGCCNNYSTIRRYAGVEHGPNHAVANFSMPFHDTKEPFKDIARVCVQPGLQKSITATSEAGTGVIAGLTHLTIGEIVRYQLQVTVPEGSSPNMVITDQLPPGLEWLSGTCSFTKDDNSVTHAAPVFQINGGSLSIPLGNVFNPPDDPSPENFTIRCNALVRNEAVNVKGGTKPNSFTVTIKPPKKPESFFSSNVVTIRIAEPMGGLVKEELPVCVPGVSGGARYRLTYSNTGTSPAYDVRVRDTLPSGVTLTGPVSVNLSNCVVVASSAPNIVDRICPALSPGNSLIVEFNVNGIAGCVPYVNSARLSYSSLPGLKGTFPNPTGFQTPGASGLPRGERRYVNTANLTTQHCADLTISETSESTNGLRRGSIITSTVTVTNVGTSPSFPPTVVQSAITIGGITQFLAGGGNGWSCMAGSEVVTCTTTDPILAQTSSTFTIQVQVVREPPARSLYDVSVSGCQDTNLNNNEASGFL